MKPTQRFATPVISVKQLQTLAPSEYILIDARSGPQAVEQYQSSHLPFALHVDLDQDLAQKSKDASVGGRHPLPAIASFATLLGSLGITSESTVIVYDDKSGANAAARFWWMLRAVGHTNVYVLDGGMQSALASGISMTTEGSHPKATMPYPVTDWQLPTASIEKVDTARTDPDYVVIDVRDAYRYRGESEPIDLVAGHIPGAINIPFSQNLNAQNEFRTKEELAQAYQSAIGDRPMDHVIVHCGSGVTACHTLLALEQAGMPGAQLYVGSWGEWSRTDRPIAIGVNP
jgi:thiosulfate/3-mercaptopyruvate sulfurtransferase